MAGDNVFRALFLLKPLPDFGLCLTGFYDFQPVAAGPFCRGRGENFHDLAILQRAVDRHDFSVDLSADHAVADLRMDVIGKIDAV